MRPADAATATLPARLTELVNHLDKRSFGWNEPAAYELGGLLADLALPPGPVRRLFEDSLAAVSRQSTGLRLRLRIDALPLAGVPWEYLCLRQASGEQKPSDFLALRRELSIARTDTVESSPWQPAQRSTVRLVIALSSPSDQLELDVSKDEDAIRQASRILNEAAGRTVFETTLANRPTSTTELEKALADGAEIFHFGGHAEFQPIDQKGKLVLERLPMAAANITTPAGWRSCCVPPVCVWQSWGPAKPGDATPKTSGMELRRR